MRPLCLFVADSIRVHPCHPWLNSLRLRALADELAAKAPAYLHPSTQLKLLPTAADCLAVLELAVNWEAEKLYGVEALGPFDEF